MTRYVVDASIAIKWFIPEQLSDAAGRLRQPGLRLSAPAFFWLEIGNVLVKKIRRGELTREEGDYVLKELRRLPLQQHADERLFRPAYTLALQTHRSLYDCLYLALAEVIDGRMVTADRKFYAALMAGEQGRRVLWVEDLPQPV
ncbi:MAG: PIN domain-containing protein [Nitrospirae bacterium]|nr:MAG: PIN domain-containing protein [Nitrospirota bacterium]